ncbi:MAG: tetratricopeptide repeat protein, partial [Rhodospirillaceae bacterium]|nr:tetratricopeptide repeat protein [Rhodospirillaceae bacterium]
IVVSKGSRDHGSALSSLALFESFKGDKKKTLDLIENAMELDGKSIDVLLKAYKVFTKLDDPKKANRVLDALQNIAPDDPRVMGLLLA